jgi:uncharacterized protein YbjT (DUF2867 family)
MSGAPRVIAVTGPLGFVASRMLPRLQAPGTRVLAIVRPGSDAGALAAWPNVEVRRGDLSEPATLRDAFTGAGEVVHLAGLALVPGMLPAILAAGVRRGAFVSSAGVHTKLVSSGAEQKRSGEAALRESSLGYTILRPSMIYGTPRDRNMVRMLRLIARWPLVPAPLGGATLQQPVHVDDLVSAILAALTREEALRREYDVGGPEPLPLAQIVRECGRALGRPAGILPLPLAPAHAMARAARAMRLPFPVSPEQVLRLTESKAVDIGPARRDLGFAPRPFREGIVAEAAMLRTGTPPPPRA